MATTRTTTTRTTTPPKATPAGIANLTPILKGTVKADDRKGLPEAFLRDLKVEAKANLTGAALARLMHTHGLYPAYATESRKGLALRNWMRARKAWVGKGRSYGIPYAVARDIAAGYTGKVALPAKVEDAS